MRCNSRHRRARGHRTWMPKWSGYTTATSRSSAHPPAWACRAAAGRCVLTVRRSSAQAPLWERIQKRVHVEEYTFPGDPMRMDYGYRRNGTRGFVHTLAVNRAPAEVKNLAYTAERIAAKVPWKSEFAAVTDIELMDRNLRHGFVRDTLRDAGIEPVPLD